MNRKFDTPEKRLEALFKNMEANAQGDPELSLSYDKSIDYLGKFSELHFTDCLVMYTSDDDVWDVWLWIDKDKKITFIWNEDKEFNMSVYLRNELIICAEYDDMDKVLDGWARVIEKVEKQPEIVENGNINQKRFSLKNKVVKWLKNLRQRR